MQDYKTIYKRLFFFLGLLALEGCKMLEPVQMPSSLRPGATFIGQQDTLDIGRLPRREFFTDPYLVALIDTALHNNSDLLVASQRIEMAQAELWRSKAYLLPTVSAEASAGVRKYGDYTMDGVGNYDTNLSDNIGQDRRIPYPVPDYFLGLRSSWEIDLWGRLRNMREAAHARFLATQQGRQLMTTQLVAQIASLYYELLTLDNELEIIRRNILLQEKAVETIEVQKEGGRASELAVRQFKAQHLNTRSLEYQKLQEVVRVENAINALLGRFPQPIQRGAPIRQHELWSQISAGVPASMLRRRPDIRQAELALTAAKADLQAARAAFLPSLTISAHTGLNAFRSAFLFNVPASLASGILGGLAVPIFNRRGLQAGERWARASSMEAFYMYNQSVVRGVQEVVTNLRSLENLEKEEELKDQEAQELQQAVLVARDMYLGGYASYLEVITAQRSVLEAELTLTHIQKQQFLSMIDLYRSLGGGWE